MQFDSRSMLQELQLQRAAQAQPGRGGPGAEPGGSATPGGGGSGGGGRVAEKPEGESETSFPFPSADLSYAAQASPFFLEGPSAPPESPLDIRTRGRGGSLEGTTVLRPGVGQRSPPPRSRASTLEAVAPQLLAQISSTDTNAPLPTPDSVDKYRTVQRASTTAHIQTLLSASPTSTLPKTSSPVQITSDTNPLAELPLMSSNLTKSKHSGDTVASNASVASSFAYQMRHNLPDLRLFKQKSKPSQHTIQKPSILKVTGDIKRSPTFFKPKVVADTAVLVAGKNLSTLPPATLSQTTHTLPEILREDSFVKGPLCRVQTLSLPARTSGNKTLQLPPVAKETWQDAGRRRLSTAARDFAPPRPSALPDPVTRQLRFENPVTTGWRNEEFSVAEQPPLAGILRKLSAEKPRKSSFAAQHLHHRHKKTYHAVTPPEEEPSATPLHHGDSYFQTFQTFPEGSVPSKEFVPIRTPEPQERWKKGDVFVRRRPESEPMPLKNTKPSTPVTHIKSSSETAAVAIPKRRRQSGMFGFFRKNASNDENLEAEQEEYTNHRAYRASLSTAADTPSTPGILLSHSQEADSKRRMSSVVPEMQTQSYFNRPRIRRLPSDNTLSPTGLVTPLSTTGEDPPTPMMSKGRIRQHNRSSSEQLSPLGTPRARHRPTMESLRSRVSQTTIKVAPAPPVPSAHVRRASTRGSRKGSLKSGSRNGSIKSIFKSDRKGSVKFADQRESSRVDASTLNRNQVILKSKPSNYFVDMRKVSSAEQLQPEINASSDTKRSHRWSLVPKLSSMSLPKISLGPLSSYASQRFRRRSSQLSSLTQASISRSPVAEPGPEFELPSLPTGPTHKGRIQPSIPVGRRFSAWQLEVTEFEQTPYSQRYHDSKRALQQQIRAFVDEGLDEGDDAEGDDELVLGFEQDVPDHFPTSPLCPLHPKHKSGGKAICPLHGRYKKGMPPPTLPAGKKPVARVSSSATDLHAGHHRMEIVLDTAVVEAPLVKEARPASLNIFGILKEDSDVATKPAVLDTAIMTTNAAMLDSAITEVPTTREGGPASVDIFGILKEDHHITTRTSILGSDGAVSIWTRTSGQSSVGRGRRREKDPRGSERKRRRRVRVCRL